MIDIILAFLLDLFLGDPYSFPHPVKAMGRIINWQEKQARKLFKSPQDLRLAGGLIVLTNIVLGFGLSYLLLKAIRPYYWIYHVTNIYLIYTCLAAKSLSYEAHMVKAALDEGIEQARLRLSYIVGRDTSKLNEEEIVKATVETVAENTCDGIIAPLLFIFFLGAPGGLAYKFVNTMDSMLGYMNEDYREIGYFPAKIDDVFNWFAARLTGVLLCIAGLFKYNPKEAWRVFKRDRLNHKSPNAGHPEAAVAGHLGLELGGSNIYNGLIVDKPTIGDNLSKAKSKHISQAVDLMYKSEFLLMFIFVVVTIIFDL
ncbi:MAG: adenosylcobinamide-phosphate synthase CbiB [Gudongella sp.]|jgi:adenosylcobinamide-phosphate synthase|nr:adenosylcobinamide-phosphate synthase CbiB [Gudongella sp.]